MTRGILKRNLSIGWIVIIFCIFVFSVTNPAHADDALTPVTLTWTAGGVGGQWYAEAGGIARLIAEKEPKLTIKAVPGGGVVNAVRVSEGRNDIGWGITFVDKMALNGVQPLYKKSYTGLRSLGGIFGKYQIHILVDKNQGIQTMADLADMVKNNKAIKISVPQRGISDLNVLEYVLEFYGISLKAIEKAGGKVFHAPYSDMVNLYKDRHVDVAVTMQSFPSAAMTEMTLSRKSNLLSISNECIDTLNKKIGTLSLASGFSAIAKGAYEGIDSDVPTVVTASELIINKDVSDIVAYTIVKILCKNIKEMYQNLPSTRTFIPDNSWTTVAVPLHPGAEKYYREAGYIK